MQETKIFKAADGKDIHVEVNCGEGNARAVLMIHGFTGHINEHIFYNAAQQWPKKGLDVWRIALYPGDGENVRTMDTLTWQQNLSDIDLVLKAMADNYEKLFLVGHSVGATQAILVQNPSIKAKALWDPFCPGDNEAPLGRALAALHPDYYTLDWGHMILAKKTYAHACIEASLYKSTLPPQPPLLVIRSSEERENRWPSDRLAARLFTIKDSDHCFDQINNERMLFRHTLGFLKALQDPVGL